MIKFSRCFLDKSDINNREREKKINGNKATDDR